MARVGVQSQIDFQRFPLRWRPHSFHHDSCKVKKDSSRMAVLTDDALTLIAAHRITGFWNPSLAASSLRIPN